MTGTERRKAALDRVASYVCKDRQQSYGDAEDNFAVIAAYWNVYLGTDKLDVNDKARLKPHDVAAMMALMKVARIHNSPWKLDNWDDLAGYAVCGSGIAQKMEEKVPNPDWKPAIADGAEAPDTRPRIVRNNNYGSIICDKCGYYSTYDLHIFNSLEKLKCAHCDNVIIK